MKTLFKDGTVIPMTGEKDRYSFLGMENGIITYLGNEEPEDFRPDSEVSLGGKFIYPTLTDSHLHLLYSIVLSAMSFNICRLTEKGVEPDTLKGIEAAVRKYVKENPKGPVIINQYIPSVIDAGRLPLASELDEWTCGREAVCFSMDAHSCSLSTALSEKLGFQTENGILDGAAYDLNQGKITAYAASAVTPSILAKGLANFTNECLSYGITRVCALDGNETSGEKKDPLLSLLIFLARRMDLSVRLFPEYTDPSVLEKIGKKMGKKRIGGCGACELDGSVGSHSAAFPRPYKDTGILAEPYHTDETVKARIAAGLSKGAVTSAHAIGTSAIDQIVKAYRSAEELIPEKGPCPRIDHFEFPSGTALKFVSSRRLAVTLQPGYAYIDKRVLHTYEKHLDEKDLAGIIPLKDFVHSGGLILGSSDSPVQGVDPYSQMRGMMDYYTEDQSLSAFEAFASYTANAARALDEKEGILREKGPATFFISSADILSMTAGEIPSVRAEEVYIRGKKAKEKKGSLAELIAMIFRKPELI